MAERVEFGGEVSNDAEGRLRERRSTAGSDTDATWFGQRARRYRSAEIEVTVLPRRGGKIASIRDASGREWLAQPTRDLVNENELPASFVDGDMCGWDECAPTISPCQVSGRDLADHGDLWSQIWCEDVSGWMTAKGKAWEFDFSRHVSVAENTIHLEYELSAGTSSFPFLWSAHPQFRVDEGSEVVLPQSVDTLLQVYGAPRVGVVDAEQVRHVRDTPRGEGRKYFVEPGFQVRELTLQHADGASLRMNWTDATPYVGIWVDRCAFSNHDVLAIEPSTGYFDDCSAAADRGMVTIVKPGQTYSWSVRVSISPSTHEVTHA